MQHLPGLHQLSMRLALGLALTRCCQSAGIASSVDAEGLSPLALVQERVEAHRVRRNAWHEWGTAEAAAATEHHQAPFAKALVVTINKDHYAAARERLEAQGVPSEAVWGFNGRSQPELAEALKLLAAYNGTDKLHATLGNFLACMHMAPGTTPHVRAALVEAALKIVHSTPRTVEELLQHDHHGCVPKMVAIAAAHVRLWEDIAAGRLPSGGRAGAAGAEGAADDPWILVMEDDAALCPGWRQRMERELPLAPPDADILKLFFFGHWRQEDQAPNAADGTPSPFLEAKNPMNTFDIAKASAYELWKGAGFDSVPIAGFYAGTQAYLVKRKGARKLLAAIKGKPFQDVDMTMMGSVKHYVWRKVLAMNAPEDEAEGHGSKSLLQVVPVCNREPPKDWWFR